MNYLKQFFYLSNIVLFIFYLYPGSIFGCFIYSDCKIQPQLTRDFLVSSNHVYVFVIISILGLIAFKNKLKNIFIYLICISIVLEILHLIIPERGFELGDLFGNIIGVFISFLVFKIIYKGRLQWVHSMKEKKVLKKNLLMMRKNNLKLMQEKINI